MKYLRLAVIALIGSSIVAAHAASPKASGYLSDYDRLVEGEYLEAFWIDMGGIEKSNSPNILLGEISEIDLKDHKGVTADDSVGWLKRDLLQSTIISEDASADYRMDVAITYMDPGSAAKRIWAGEFGAGHAQLQIEGKMISVDTGNVVAEFAERRRSSGAIGVKDLVGDAGPHIIEHLVKLISDDVANELLAAFTPRVAE